MIKKLKRLKQRLNRKLKRADEKTKIYIIGQLNLIDKILKF